MTADFYIITANKNVTQFSTLLHHLAVACFVSRHLLSLVYTGENYCVFRRRKRQRRWRSYTLDFAPWVQQLQAGTIWNVVSQSKEPR